MYQLTIPPAALRRHAARFALLVCTAATLGAGPGALATPGDYREPAPAVVGLLTAEPPPETLLDAGSGQVALVYRQAVVSMDWLARARLGLAGYRFDPVSGSSGAGPLVTQVELVRADAPEGTPPVVWRPAGGGLLDFVDFSPDGKLLSAVLFSGSAARLVLFDIASGRERVLDTPINAAWGNPCAWTHNGEMVCRVLVADRGLVPAEQPAPVLVEHTGGAAPVRTYTNLLENDYEDRLFDYYFGSGVAIVDRTGAMRRVPGLEGLLFDLEPSPDGTYALLTRLHRPYPRMVPARYFPSSVEVWDLGEGRQLYASTPAGYGVEAGDEDDEDPRRFAWKPGEAAVIGVIEKNCDPSGACLNRWMQLTAPFTAEPVELASTGEAIQRFGWTSAGTAWFSTRQPGGEASDLHIVSREGTRTIYSGSAQEKYDDQGHAIRRDGAQGPVLELDDRIYIAGDGLGANGPQPFLQSFNLRDETSRRLFTADPGVYEVVLAILGDAPLTFITSRETDSEPPSLYLYRDGKRALLHRTLAPYPQLDGTQRRVLAYRRNDGVDLSATLYLPAGYREGQRLPTLIWIYPYEFSDRDEAEQLDVRAFRYHRVKGPSPLAAVVAGYAVLVYPKVPILYRDNAVNDDYLAQLVASVEAAADYLVQIGVTDPGRIAVGGRSYGAFSTANLLIHSDRFAGGIAMSGAYNRTLTPFGFQHEKRSFWEATDTYTNISPFFHANRIRAPILLVHGGADENAGTAPVQTRRFFHALSGEGKVARYVELPYEGHNYWARENVLLATAEMLDWLQRIIGPGIGALDTGEQPVPPGS